MDTTNTVNLPKNLIEQLEGYGISADSIFISALADMNLDCQYEPCYIIVCKDKLVMALGTTKKRETHIYGKHRDSSKLFQSYQWAVKIFDLNKYDSLDIQPLISGGVLFGVKDENPVSLVAFSGSQMGDFRRLVNVYNKLAKNEELTDEDLKPEDDDIFCPKCGAIYPDRARKICPKCMDRRSVFFRMLAYFKPYTGKIVVMMLCYLGAAGLNLVWPYLNGTVLYDKVFGKNEEFLRFVGLPAGKFTVLLAAVVLSMVITKFIGQVLGIIQGVMTAKIVPDVVKTIKSQVFDSMGRLSINFFTSRQTGSLMTRVLDDANFITGFFIDGLPYFFINVLTIISTCTVLVMINWKLAIASLILLPLLTFVSYKLLPRLWHYYGKRHRASRSLYGQLNDNLTGARVVKAFGQEDREIKRFERYNSQMRDAELSLVGFDNRFYALYSAVQNIASFIVWGFGSIIVLYTGDLEVGMLISFAGYVTQLNGPLDFMSHIFRWWAESANSAQRIFEIIDSHPEVAERDNPVHMPEIKGKIKINNMTFGYEPNKPVLKNIDLEIKPGELLGIVGRSGAGKSTLVNLISRLYDPDEGDIYIDDVNIKDMSFKDLRRSVAMVSQETYIFMGTVAENIAYSNPDATPEQIVAAAIAASAHDFICKMPDGYDTIIGSSGRELSGGERQRISIARAILANPKILILDEATASVDTETERAIQRSLDRLVKGRTTISIAHRLSTLANADRLVVLDEGRITECGTHEELIKLEGTYYKLVQLQKEALTIRGISEEDI
ncbi:MAG TPA: ATP-binding cassette domain-containing protein [Clostridiales bacterium]|nr:ATP-binding cassette domain-containing protein [Clostridiales bacterium]